VPSRGTPATDPAANNPAHRRIVAQALGIVHVFVSSEPPKHGLPQQTNQRMTAVLPGTCVGEQVTRYAARKSAGKLVFAFRGDQTALPCR
jgi:hypothetical protein